MDKNNNICDCNKKNECDFNEGKRCTCVPTCKKEDECDYYIDEDSIFFKKNQSDVENFKLKDVWVQMTLNGSVVVPDCKYSIEQIDSITQSVQILSKKVVETPAVYSKGEVVDSVKNEEGKITTGRKLIVEGLICVSISYVALKSNQSVNSFSGSIPFSAFIVLPEDANIEDYYEVYSLIEGVCVKSVCERSVNLTFALLLTAEKIEQPDCKYTYDNSGIDCYSGIDDASGTECFKNQPVIQGICSKNQIQNLITDDSQNLWTEISIPELLTIPCPKPDVLQVLTVTSKVQVMCQNIINTPVAHENYEGLKLSGLKLLIHAVLRQRITYISNDNCKSVHSAHFDVPVSAYIVLPYDSSPLSKYNIRTCIEDIYACALNERQVFKNTTLFIKAEPIVCL